MIKKPEPVFIQLETGPNHIESVPLHILVHLYGDAERLAKAAGEENNTQAIYDFFAQRLADHFKVTKENFPPDMVVLIVREFSDKYMELKKNYVTSEDSQSS